MTRSTMIKPFMGLGCLAILMALWGCGDQGRMSTQAYQRYVLEAINGHPLQDDGLKDILSITLGDLGCEDELCTAPIRFQYLTQEVQPRQVFVADYYGRICRREEIKPPSVDQQHHKTLCESLSTLFKSLDTIVVNASNALRLGTTSTETQDAETAAPLREEVAKRLNNERKTIQAIQDTLKEIQWLRNAL